MTKLAILFTVALLSATVLFGQRKPKWINSTPQSTSGKFIYSRGDGEDDIEAIGEAISVNALISCDKKNIQQKIADGVMLKDDKRNRIFTSQRTLDMDCEGQKIEITLVEDFVNDRDHKHYALISSEKPNFEGFWSPQKPGRLRNIHYAWRSAIIPGLGQVHNKQAFKAVLFIGGVATFAGLAGYSNKQYDYYTQKGNEASYFKKGSYYAEADKWNKNRKSMLMGVGIVWLVNVIDAASGRSNRYAILSNKNADLQIAANGFSLKINI